MPSTILRERLSPPSLIAEASSQTLREFEAQHSDTQFLLVSLEGDAGELNSGLTAMSAVVGTALLPGMASTGFETQVGDRIVTRIDSSIPPPCVFDEAALHELLAEGPFFAVALRKRVSAGGSDRIRVGRSSSTDVILQQSGISKFHAWLEMDEDGVFYVADAGSKNGTRVNGDPLDQHEMVRVRPGDRIEFGTIVATLCSPETLWRAMR